MDYISIATILRMYGFELIRNIYTNQYVVYDLSNYNMIPLNIFLSNYFLTSVNLQLQCYKPPSFIPYNTHVTTPKPNINTSFPSSPLSPSNNRNRSYNYRSKTISSNSDNKDWRFF